MAYNDSLSNIGPQGTRPRLWSYDSLTDNRAAVVASGYFNPAAEKLQIRDVILVKASDQPVILAVANITSAGVVTTTRLDAVA